MTLNLETEALKSQTAERQLCRGIRMQVNLGGGQGTDQAFSDGRRLGIAAVPRAKVKALFPLGVSVTLTSFVVGR